jgi:hypothetical protein
MSLLLDGTLGISATGNIVGGNVIASGTLIAGAFTPASLSTTGNVTGAYIVGDGSALTNVAASTATSATTAGTVTANAQGNITSVGILTSLSVTGTVTAGQHAGNGNTLSNIQGANVSGAVSSATSATTAGTVTANAQGNITSVGTLTALTVTGNIAGGNVTTGGLISATGNITGGNLSVSTGTVTLGNIVNANGNGVGNIGSSSLYFNTIFAKATSAQYADLAEMYCADSTYKPGTVVVFGGEQEITASTLSHDPTVAGIVSTNPSYLMNSALDCTNAIEIALVGRVPCQVVGNIKKGDRLVASNIPGVATVLDPALYQPGCIVGKALEAYNSDQPGVIEVAVGRN